MNAQIANCIEQLQTLHATGKTGQDADLFKGINKAIVALIKENPALLSGDLLDALEGMAMNSSNRDIHIAIATDLPPASPQQYFSISATYLLKNLSWQNPASGTIECLENIALNSLDLAVRKEVIYHLCELIGVETPARPRAVAALERQGQENSNPYLRSSALQLLYSLAREQEREQGADKDLLPIAIAALVRSTEDSHPDTRNTAVGQLINAVRTAPCQEQDIRKLTQVFEKAAAYPAADTDSVEHAKVGIHAVQQRLEKGPGWWKKQCEAEEKSRKNGPTQG